jgi:hypothetical protein
MTAGKIPPRIGLSCHPKAHGLLSELLKLLSLNLHLRLKKRGKAKTISAFLAKLFGFS